MPLINWKAELKIIWTKYCDLPLGSTDNTYHNYNNNTFTIKDTYYMFL